MPREAEGYRDVLEQVRERTEALYPGKMQFNMTEIARIVGCERHTARSRGFWRGMTAPDIARTLCQGGQRR